MPRYLLLLLVPFAAALTACDDTARTSWMLTAQPDASDTTLQLIVMVGGCDEFERFDIKKSEPRPPLRGQSPSVETESVTIEAFIHTDVRSPCPAILLHEEQTVELDTPLGDRTLKGCSPTSAKHGPVRRDLPNDDCGALIYPGVVVDTAERSSE